MQTASICWRNVFVFCSCLRHNDCENIIISIFVILYKMLEAILRSFQVKDISQYYYCTRTELLSFPAFYCSCPIYFTALNTSLLLINLNGFLDFFFFATSSQVITCIVIFTIASIVFDVPSMNELIEHSNNQPRPEDLRQQSNDVTTCIWFYIALRNKKKEAKVSKREVTRTYL